eukprot:5301658-Karenia_brevis.AAC.1
MHFRDRAWLQKVEAENNGRQLHCRRLKIWRWERPMVKYAESVAASCWHELAADKRSWITKLEDMAYWLRTHRA